MSHMPDKEFVAYFKKNIDNPFLPPTTMMRMEQVFMDQRTKYEQQIQELKQRIEELEQQA